MGLGAAGAATLAGAEVVKATEVTVGVAGAVEAFGLKRIAAIATAATAASPPKNTPAGMRSF
jgi:hypothetical protein